MKFKLYFSNNTLYKISLHNHNTSILVRGKNPNNGYSTGSFQWTEAVKALAELLLSYHIEGTNTLVGFKGDSSVSLDYALSKPPVWMKELFLLDENGISSLRRLFHRVNPEAKLSGPTAVSINTNLVSRQDIEIFSESSLTNDNEKKNILNSLRKNEISNFNSTLIKIYSEETSLALNDKELFLNLSYNKTIKELVCSRSVKSVLKRNKSLSALLNNRVTKSFIPSFEMPELEFATTYTQAGTLAIFNNLKTKYNFKINHSFPYAVPLANSILDYNYSPDVCCLGWGPALKVLNNSDEYVPLTLGPRISHTILSSPDISGSGLMMVNDEPTTASFCLDQLKDAGKISEKVKIKHYQPDEMHLLAKNKSLVNALLWFPHYKLIDNGEMINSQYNDEFLQYTMILLHRRNLHLLQKIKVIINNSWLNLITENDISAVTANYLNKSFVDEIKNYTWN